MNSLGTRILIILMAASVSLGFGVYNTTQKWPISASDPKLWIRFCRTKIINENDFKRDDPLFGATITFNSINQSILDNFNNLASAWITLADAATDPAFGTTANSVDRVIDVCFEDLGLGVGGHAKPVDDESGGWRGCEIVLDNDVIDSARGYVKTLSHEIGHCLGLAHPQDTEHALMSYFSSDDISRLQIDDKMGLTFLYPTDKDMAKESNTYGLSCSPRD